MSTVASQTDSYTLPLADPAATLEVAGGKGSSLARLAAAELPVPPGFHVTTAAYRRFVAADGLHDRIVALAADAVADRPETWSAAADAITELFAAQPVPEDIARQIAAAYERLGGVEVAVRSSATAEDLPGMSFAGQQETYLNIHGLPEVLDAVRRCWASLWTDRAIGYRARHQVSSEEVALAVVVQELVFADAAGVAFTADPVTGARDRVLINAAWGLGEAIVSGQVTPDTVVVGKSDGAVLRQDISDKKTMTVRTATGTREEPVPENRRLEPVLRPAEATELARLATRIEDHYGGPMDIEWALRDHRFFIVQARPITALPEPQPQPRWELPDPRGKYVRGSVMELLPEPLSPLFATLAIPAWERATSAHYHEIHLPYFDDPMAVINGYGYYNTNYTGLLALRMALAQPRFLARTLPRHLRTAPQRWRSAHESYRAAADHWQTIDPATVAAGRLLAGAREIVDAAADYYLAIQGGALPAAYMSEALFTKAYNLVRRGDDPPATAFLLGYPSKPIQAEQALYDLARWARSQPGLAERLTELPPARRADVLTEDHPEDQVWEQFRARFRAHLQTYGDMVYDLDFAKPLPAEHPATLLQTLLYFLTDEAADPHVRQRVAADNRAEAVRVLRSKRRGLRRSLALRLMGWAQSAAPLRENALADVGLGWPAVRQLFGELGRRLTAAEVIADAGDVYWLRLPELEAAAAALDAEAPPVDSRASVARRRAEWQAQRAMKPPHMLPEKAKVLGIDFSKEGGRHRPDDPTAVIAGTPGSPGQVTGPARIIHGPSEFDRMRPGDVLVAPMTTPAWTPLFALASAIVTDVGGALSHSSIVAREFHIPAVLGTGAATERLHDGQQITVDGDNGTVAVHDQKDPR
ncbi:phosphoenolpyruvate synthase [Nocardia tenerifensis]|uniref:Phosphoenolpyruvate synthase n=1 Tax=Nocardia tenerifensis TaxID=228006 RepID=A0A318KCQ7_9NOCA|nr:PEP/pyruvate-binding domain-containing protein [Nocardia tenerifensis]PXX71617.1 phosphoenolpyruvate synthase [Nocardia tenerifensis]